MSTLFEETDRVIYDQTQVLGTTGQRATTPMLYPTSPAEPVRIVLAWTDAPGSPFASAWVNDLNLRVVVDSSTEYLGNVFDSGQSSTGGTADPKNNLEAVYFPAEGVGGFVVHVDAAAINGDGIPGNVDLTDQDFALYIYNAAERPSCTSDADCDNGDPCTSGLCEADGRCTFAEACNDGDACTIDECEPDTGSCTHGALDCSDGNECTRDACDSVLGCVSTNADDCAACDGGQNVCVSGICGGMPYLTDDDFESGSLSKPWSTGGNAPWYLTNVTASGGGWSAASGNISDNQRSWLEVPVELGSAGTVSFNHRESTERHWDELCFAVDGVNLDCWSGSSNWLVAPSSFALAAGSHTLQWIYTKDFLLSDRRDTVYIDDVEVSGSVSCGGGACSSGHYGSAGCVTCQLPDGTSCESTSACMDGSTCIGGACGTPRDCSTYDAECSVGQCDPATGSCMAIAADDGTACNDSDPCTQGDVCVGGACRGTVVDCASLDDACNVAQCGAGSGTCEKNPMLDGTPCDDSNPCTDGDRCSSGVCAGSAADCSNTNEPCRIGQCDPLSGSCKAAPVSDGTACDDSDPCTDRDRCVAGDCRGTPVECSLGSDMCAVRRCSAETGGCELVPVPDGTSCDDGSECTVGDGCRGGVCAGATVECSGPNRECSASECDPATGKCNMAKSADGTSCNDSAPCTTDDVCSDGECVGTPIDCSGLTSPCVIGECDTSTGDCRTIPVENETPCSGGECQSGDCVARTGQGGGSSTASGGQDSSTDGGADASGGQDFASGGSSLGSGGDRTSGAGGSTGAGTGGGTGAGGTAGSGASTGTGGLGVTLGSGGGGPGITLGGGGGLDVTPGSGGGLGITLGRGGGPGIVFGGIGGSGTTSGSAGSVGSLLGSGGAGGVSIAPTADSSAGAAGQEPAISALANARSLNPGGWDYRLTGRACTCRVVAPPRSGDVWSLGLIGAALYLRRMRRRRT